MFLIILGTQIYTPWLVVCSGGLGGAALEEYFTGDRLWEHKDVHLLPSILPVCCCAEHASALLQVPASPHSYFIGD